MRHILNIQLDNHTHFVWTQRGDQMHSKYHSLCWHIQTFQWILLLFTTGPTREREKWSRLRTHSHRYRQNILRQTHTTTGFFTRTHRYRIFSQTHTSAKYFHKFTQVKNILTNTHNYWIFSQGNTTIEYFPRHTHVFWLFSQTHTIIEHFHKHTITEYFCKHTRLLNTLTKTHNYWIFSQTNCSIFSQEAENEGPNSQNIYAID